MARVGISTANPLAMLDITDRRKGQFLFNPQDKDDPAFSISISILNVIKTMSPWASARTMPCS